MKEKQNKFAGFKIGGLVLKNNLIAAPMAGLSSLPYRLLAMQEGCALAISEMVSAEGIIRAHKKTERYFTNDERARPFGCQVFGANPNAISDAIRFLEDKPIDLFDINMGCPVKKVAGKGAGSALMGTPKLAAEIIRAARASTKKPLTVKLRLGINDSSVNCVEMANIAEDMGADAVTVHGRTMEQFFRGVADWSYIGKVKSKIKIPVIGNGDIKCRSDALRIIDETGCDGIMIGRAAVGNPWIFRQILDENFAMPSLREREETALNHMAMLREFMGDKLAILNMRTLLAWYCRGLFGVKKFLQEVHQTKDAEAMKALIEKFFRAPQKTSFEAKF